MAFNVGGSFAPPLSLETLETYKALAAEASAGVKSAMGVLITMLETFWETPESTMPGTPHPVGIGVIVPLEDEEKVRLSVLMPSVSELDVYGKMFCEITDAPLRNAAFHLLWYGRELSVGREPLTNDKL